eukprot:g2045.t1
MDVVDEDAQSVMHALVHKYHKDLCAQGIDPNEAAMMAYERAQSEFMRTSAQSTVDQNDTEEEERSQTSFSVSGGSNAEDLSFNTPTTSQLTVRHSSVRRPTTTALLEVARGVVTGTRSLSSGLDLSNSGDMDVDVNDSAQVSDDDSLPDLIVKNSDGAEAVRDHNNRLDAVKHKSNLVEEEVETLSLSQLETMIEVAQELVSAGVPSSDAFRELVNVVGKVFSSSSCLGGSFLSLKDMEECKDKGKEKHQITSKRDSGVNTSNLHCAVQSLLTADEQVVQRSFKYALKSLASNLSVSASMFSPLYPTKLRSFMIFSQSGTLLQQPEHHEVVKMLGQAIEKLSPGCRALLGEWWSYLPKEQLEEVRVACQQYITIKFELHLDEDGHARGNLLDWIRPAVELLGLVYDGVERKLKRDIEEYYLLQKKKVEAANGDKEMLNDGVGLPPRRQPCIPYASFNNEAINKYINFNEDYRRWKDCPDKFSFCRFNFVLNPASKAKILKADAQRQMMSEQRDTIMLSLFAGQLSIMPYLVLRVNRSNIVADTLEQLSMKPWSELKKPLKVKFLNEEGVDEGGVKKEFFQVIIRELIMPEFGMFKVDDRTRLFWFNGQTFEPSIKFELIGKILGIAIYNQVIIDVRFPMIVYRKLLGHKPTLDDLEEIFPDVAKSLKDLLDMPAETEEEREAIEDCTLSFDVTQQWLGQVKTIELCPNGKNIPVTYKNREKYTELYVDYLLNVEVEKQFGAFARAFTSVCGGKTLELFRAEELELLICGNPELDFEALEKVARYDDGYTKDDQVIRNFWSVVHEMDIQEKKKLLSFATGSDRAPINGLGDLKLVITKNGEDSSMLPTSHTCFNHLLLPAYSDREKMKKQLKTAITQSEGFGLL